MQLADPARAPRAPGRLNRELPPSDPEFTHVRRYFDPTRARIVAKILPGEYYVTTDNELISTTLGSCVAACIRDPVFGIAGMNHFMLPVDRGHRPDMQAAIYGNQAMELLINALLKRGASRQRLEVKLFGGGQVLAGVTDVGRSNIEFVREYMHVEGFPILAEDLGGQYPRKLMYDPLTGKVQVKRLLRLHNDTIQRREADYRRSVVQPLSTDIELFD